MIAENTKFLHMYSLYQHTKQLLDLRLLYGDFDSTCAISATECVDNDFPSTGGIWAETYQLPRGVVL